MQEQSWDPQGQALLDFVNGNEDISLKIHSAEEMMEVPVQWYFRSWDQFPELEQYALSLCNGKVLDIGAGSGCHALALQEMGLDVTTIDISSKAVDAMRKQGLKNVIEGDVFKTKLMKFDTVAMFMNGIGFVQDLKGLTHFLNFVKDIVHPEGQLIFDSTDLAIDSPERKKGSGRRYYGIIDYQIEYNGKKGSKFKWLFIDPVKLNAIAKKAGWHCQIVYDDEGGHYLARLRLY